MASLKHALFALSCFTLLACGDDDAPSAPQQCDDLVADLCMRGVECLGGTDSDEQECIAAIKADLACGDADKVSGSYPRCIDQVNTNSCSSLFPVNAATGQQELELPADCEGVILFE